MGDAVNAETLGPREGDALVVIDVQRDFLLGGALPVPHGDQVVPVLNRAIACFRSRRLPIFATRDWHPPNHCSFVEQGGPWPAHCVIDSPGARFADKLKLPPDVEIVSKATTPKREAYSDFFDTGFDDQLQSRGIRRLFVGGLATEYCVWATVHDALELGYEVVLLIDAIRPLDEDEGRHAVEDMIDRGAFVATSRDLQAMPQ
jgi:nicotinamidase/pyrazinamidase